MLPGRLSFQGRGKARALTWTREEARLLDLISFGFSRVSAISHHAAWSSIAASRRTKS